MNRRIRQYRRRSLDRRAAKFASGEPSIPDTAANPTKAPPINRWEHRYLGQERFPETLSALEIEHFFTLDEDELAPVRERRGPWNRLALALQIGFLKLTGRTLNSVELIPPQILDHLGRQVDCPAPRIASIRAFYRRRPRTLFEHHAAALRLLGRSELTLHAERGLVAYLRREATAVFDDAELMARARSWLVGHDYLLLRERHIRRLAIAARRHQQQALFKLIAAAMPVERETWVPRLLARLEEGGVSRREWLDAVPSSRSAPGLAEQMEKVSFLKELGADRLLLPDLPLAGLEYFARRMMSRKPAALARIKEPHRTIEVACFLRLTLLRLMDGNLTLLDHQISALWRGNGWKLLRRADCIGSAACLASLRASPRIKPLMPTRCASSSRG